MAILEEIDEHSREELKSELWGSFFHVEQGTPTFMFDLVRNHSKLAIPSLEALANFKSKESLFVFSKKPQITNGVVPGFIPPLSDSLKLIVCQTDHFRVE